MPRNTISFSVSFPPKLRRELKRESKQLDVSQSAILQDAFRAQILRKRLERVQQVGQRAALQFGIESEADLMRLLAGK